MILFQLAAIPNKVMSFNKQTMYNDANIFGSLKWLMKILAHNFH